MATLRVHVARFLLLALGLAMAHAAVMAQSTDWTDLLEAAKPSVAQILTQGSPTGSGAIISPDGYILTAAHVIEGATRITVIVDGSREYSASIVNANYAADTALLRISASGLTWLALGDSDALLLDEEIRLLGYPVQKIVGIGLIIGRGNFLGHRKTAAAGLIQLAISPFDHGHSGGPVINKRGEIVGVAVGTQFTGERVFPELKEAAPILVREHHLAVSANTARQIIPSYVLPTGPSPVRPATGPGAPAVLVRVPQDQATLAAAVRVAAEGAEIQVARGTYRGDLSLSKAVTIAGESGAVIEGTVRISGRNVTLAGVKIVGGVEIRDSASFALNRVTVAASPGDGVLIEASTGVLTGCTIEDAKGSGIVVSFASRVTVAAMIVRRSGKAGILLLLGPQARITECTIEQNRGDGVTVAGSTAHIQDTAVRGNGGCGVRGDTGSAVSGSVSSATTTDNQAGDLCGEALKLDSEPPMIVARLDPSPNAAGWNSSDVQVAFACADALSGIASCSEPKPFAQEGVHETTGEAVDRAGNRVTATATVRIDRTPPTGCVTVEGGAAETTSSVVTLRVTASDALSGVAEMRFSNDGRTWSPWETYAATRSDWDLTGYGGAPTEGAKTVYVQVKDRAGNESSVFSSTIALLASSRPLPSPGNLRVTPSAWSNVASFALNWDDPAQIPPRAAAWYKLGSPPQGPDDGTRVTGKPIQVRSPGDGEHILYVWLEDGAGRRDHAQASAVRLLSDRTPPIGLLAINVGAATTTSPLVTLTVSATDALSGVAEMRFANDGSTWSDWEPFKTSRPDWDLTRFGGAKAEGVKTVHGQVRDRAGNVSPTFSASIRYAVPPPPFPLTMVLIPAGSFRMGDSFGEGGSDERPVHTVYVSAFYMDKHEVTKALWDEVAAWAERNGYDIKPGDGSGKALNHPVHNVTWYEAVKWANARSEREGLTPCYTVGGTVYRTGGSAPDCNWTASGYRLPTEAEWEKAARGGCDGRRFPWCDADTITHSRANYYSDSGYSYDTSPTRGYHPTYKTGSILCTSPVGSFAPNGYGLYDMAGNVWEWCWDWYSSGYYATSPGSDPRGPGSGSSRVIRGGSWFGSASYCRVANRIYHGPGYGDHYIYLGFRLVRTVP